MFAMMVMFLAVMMMAVVMFMFVRVAADFHVVAAETASAFFAHKFRLTTKYTKHTKRFCQINASDNGIFSFQFVCFVVVKFA